MILNKVDIKQIKWVFLYLWKKTGIEKKKQQQQQQQQNLMIWLLLPQKYCKTICLSYQKR